MQINWMEEKIPEIRTVKVNDNFIAISFFEHSEICVWHAHSKELVNPMNAYSVVHYYICLIGGRYRWRPHRR